MAILPTAPLLALAICVFSVSCEDVKESYQTSKLAAKLYENASVESAKQIFRIDVLNT
ncbi:MULTISPECIES: hypothetical protein [unclassified Wolbachia]|uniref:hypothetical protein n=1 Tax=unclassified Wolbachia TaxID=2640676 RepID=UPI00222FFF86|nr:MULTISPECIES: hypothetical protein [unclassified Wolbachia]